MSASPPQVDILPRSGANVKTASQAIATVLITSSVILAQSVGTPKIPEDWIKTTVLIERREVRQVQGYAPL